MQRTDSIEKTLMLAKVEGRRRREQDDRGWNGCMASPTQWTWFWLGSGSWWCTGRPGELQSMGSLRVGHNWVTELTDWLISKIFPGGTIGKELACQCRRQATCVGSPGCEDPLEECMGTHSRIQWTEEPGGLQFMGLQRVRHNCSDSMHWSQEA